MASDEDIRAAEKAVVAYAEGIAGPGSELRALLNNLRALQSPLPSREFLQLHGKCAMPELGPNRGEKWGAYWLRWVAEQEYFDSTPLAEQLGLWASELEDRRS